jgi:HEAT repeat protein
MMDQGSPAVREVLIRRLETPLAAAATSEADDLTLALLGNAVRTWVTTATTVKQHRLMVTFAARVASSPDLLKRSPAIKSVLSVTLTSLGSTAAEEVLELLIKAEPALRDGASHVAGMLGSSMVLPLISVILTHTDQTVRRTAATTLKEIGDGARQLAGQVKPDTPASVVRHVLSIFELTGAGGPEVSALTRAAVGHPDPSAREAAGALLVRAKSMFSPILLSEILARPEPVLQKAAITAAKDLKMKEAGAGVLKIAETTSDEDMLRAACNYFREVPSDEALPLLSKLFASRTRAFGLLKGMSDPTRVAAIEALRRLNHPDARRLVDKALGDGSETVRRAAKPSP